MDTHVESEVWRSLGTVIHSAILSPSRDPPPAPSCASLCGGSRRWVKARSHRYRSSVSQDAVGVSRPGACHITAKEHPLAEKTSGYGALVFHPRSLRCHPRRTFSFRLGAAAMHRSAFLSMAYEKATAAATHPIPWPPALRPRASNQKTVPHGHKSIHFQFAQRDDPQGRIRYRVMVSLPPPTLHRFRLLQAPLASRQNLRDRRRASDRRQTPYRPPPCDRLYRHRTAPGISLCLLDSVPDLTHTDVVHNNANGYVHRSEEAKRYAHMSSFALDGRLSTCIDLCNHASLLFVVRRWTSPALCRGAHRRRSRSDSR